MSWIVAIIVIAAAGFALLYLHDRYGQREHSVLINYPVIGWMRYFMERLGVYFRQYWFIADWEERPFNRMTRGWVYSSAKAQSNLVSFGSEVDLQRPGQIIFLNSAFPVNDEEVEPFKARVIGEGHVATPYQPKSFFNISAMSYGALSSAAVTALSHGAAQAGTWLNTGEGGLSPHHLSGGCDIVFQMGTAKYGCRDENGRLSDDRLREIAQKPQVKMIEIKLSQGAKPGKGGILPAAKVTEEVSRIRGIPIGQSSISPNRHYEIADVDSLIAFVERVRRIAEKPTGVKFVLGDEEMIDVWFAKLAKDPALAPDFITLDGAEGGTGAAPAPLADHVGQAIGRSLPFLISKLQQYGLRDRIAVIASGKLLTPDRVAWALCTGADFVNSARGHMFALGCLQSLKCDTGRCPTGVTSNDPAYMKALDAPTKATRVANYVKAMRHDVEVIAHSCGCPSVRAFKPRHVRVTGEFGLAAD